MGFSAVCSGTVAASRRKQTSSAAQQEPQQVPRRTGPLIGTGSNEGQPTRPARAVESCWAGRAVVFSERVAKAAWLAVGEAQRRTWTEACHAVASGTHASWWSTRRTAARAVVFLVQAADGVDGLGQQPGLVEEPSAEQGRLSWPPRRSAALPSHVGDGCRHAPCSMARCPPGPPASPPRSTPHRYNPHPLPLPHPHPPASHGSQPSPERSVAPVLWRACWSTICRCWQGWPRADRSEGRLLSDRVITGPVSAELANVPSALLRRVRCLHAPDWPLSCSFPPPSEPPSCALPDRRALWSRGRRRRRRRRDASSITATNAPG
jgi:hypothetical protein